MNVMVQNKGSFFKEEDGSEEIDPQVGFWKMDELSHPSSMTIFVHLLIRTVTGKVTIVT